MRALTTPPKAPKPTRTSSPSSATEALFRSKLIQMARGLLPPVCCRSISPFQRIPIRSIHPPTSAMRCRSAQQSLCRFSMLAASWSRRWYRLSASPVSTACAGMATTNPARASVAAFIFTGSLQSRFPAKRQPSKPASCCLRSRLSAGVQSLLCVSKASLVLRWQGHGAPCPYACSAFLLFGFRVGLAGR